MRKVVLKPSDFEMFDTDINSMEFEFFQKHKDAFKRMWIEQGKKFWIQFVITFRQFAVDYGTIKEFPAKNEQFEDFVDQAFIIIHDTFVDGKFGTARNFIMDIVMVAQNRHTLQHLESKSYAKDPFYNKETRDVFRRLFGAPTEKSSYVKVYILLPLYMKYGGAVCICLRRWLEAEDCIEDIEIEESVTRLDQHNINNDKDIETSSVCNKTLTKDGNKTVSLHSKNIQSIEKSEEITAAEEKNKMRDKKEINCKKVKEEDAKRQEIKKENCEKKNGDGGIKNGKTPRKEDEIEKKKTEKRKPLSKNIEWDGDKDSLEAFHKLENLSKDFVHSMNGHPFIKSSTIKVKLESGSGKEEKSSVYHSDSKMEEDVSRMQAMEEAEARFQAAFKEEAMYYSDDYFKMYIDEVTKGSKLGPVFVPDWPADKDPRFHDPDNPMYDPNSKKEEWKSNLKLGDFQMFVRYVLANYSKGKKTKKVMLSTRLDLNDRPFIVGHDVCSSQSSPKCLSRGTPEEVMRREKQEKLAKEEEEKRKKIEEERKRQKKIRKKLKKGLPLHPDPLGGLAAVPKKGLPVHSDPLGGSATVLTPNNGNPQNNIIVVGAPGSGKSSLGRLLASQLGCSAVDVDSNRLQTDGKGGITVAEKDSDYCYKCNGCKPQGPNEVCPVHKVAHKVPVHPKGKDQGTDPRKPYNMDNKTKEKPDLPKYHEPSLIEKRKDTEQTEPNSVKLTKKVDEKAGTISLTIEKRDQKGRLTKETTVKPLSEDANIWEEAMKKITPETNQAPPILNDNVQKKLAEKLSQNNYFVNSSGDSFDMPEGLNNSSTWLQGDDMQEQDRKQFREMYREISSAIADVSKQNQAEEDGRCTHFMCNHDTRHEKARNRLRRKIGERRQDRKHPDLPGLLRLGGTVEYPANEREAMMITLAEMTKMSPREKELFQERLGRTKYFKDCQEDPRDVADSMGACLFPGMKQSLMDTKAKKKKERVRAMEAEEEKEKRRKKQENQTEESSNNSRGNSPVSSDDKLNFDDLRKVIRYKDDVKRMKEELHYNSIKLNHMMEKQKDDKKDFVKTGREFDEQVKKASQDLKILEEKIALLDKECEGIDNPEFNANVLKASEELKAVKKKVEKWEADADVLNEKLDKFEKEGDVNALLDGEPLEEVDEADKDTHSDKDELDYVLSKRDGPIDQEKAFEDFKVVMGLENFPFLDDKPKKEGSDYKIDISTKKGKEVYEERPITKRREKIQVKIVHDRPMRREKKSSVTIEDVTDSYSNKNSPPTSKKHIDNENKNQESGEKVKGQRQLKSCSGCSQVEPSPKAFKKCQKCKTLAVKAARYYCGRECQVSDWKKRHRQEHADGNL